MAFFVPKTDENRQKKCDYFLKRGKYLKRGGGGGIADWFMIVHKSFLGSGSFTLLFCVYFIWVDWFLTHLVQENWSYPIIFEYFPHVFVHG